VFVLHTLIYVLKFGVVIRYTHRSVILNHTDMSCNVVIMTVHMSVYIVLGVTNVENYW